MSGQGPLYLIAILLLAFPACSRSTPQNLQTLPQAFVDELPVPHVIHVAPGTSEVTITASQFSTHLHRDLPEQNLWGYEGTSPGPTIEVESGHSLRVHWKDQLPLKHLFPEPHGVEMGGGSMPDVRFVTHLHGASVSEPDIQDRLHNNDGWPDAWITEGKEQIADYPNLQSARTLWYHDHASGETGRNVAAGLVGLYLIHDDYERSLHLPDGKYDIPLLIRSHQIGADGSLSYVKDIATEYYGNVASVNGKLSPFLDVEPRKYRFRFVNGSNARSYAMKLIDQSQRVQGPAFYQIGSDGGFLEKTVILNDPADSTSSRLLLLPGERADVVIDFSHFKGHSLLLSNNHVDPADAVDAEVKIPWLMLFRVKDALGTPDTSRLPMQMKPIQRTDPHSAKVTRRIVFGQMKMPDGTPMLTLNGKAWRDPIEEKPVHGTTEVWELINTLPDEHPFHIHLVPFQVLDRTPIDLHEYKKSGRIQTTGEPVPPAPNERGWKDTVRVSRSAMTRIVLRFDSETGYYVYHCHILEHEDMDMMRPFQVVNPKN